jgi:hypothetical protein
MGIDALKTTNGIVYALSLIGGSILLFLGFSSESSDTVIAYGFTALLISTLLFQLVALFADHIEDSFKKRSEIITLLRKLNQLP